MKKWRCTVCGYIHEGETPPEVCPVCGVGSEEFEETYEPDVSEGPSSPERIVIIGNGVAGIEAARTIRELNSQVDIKVFTDEPFHFYSRIQLSTFIGEEIPPKKLLIYPREWYREQNIQVFLENPIVEILPEERRVKDKKGTLHLYDRLIITTGAEPFIPPIKGIEKKGIFALRNLQDGLKIREFSSHCHTAVVIGGGILGIETAATLQRKGLSVTVIEVSDHIMQAQLDKEGAGILQYSLEKRGISFRIQATVQEIGGNERVDTVLLSSGEKIPADLVLISTGIRPGTELARASGITVKRGIVVNEYMQTNQPNIFAAGDAAEFRGTIYGIWPAGADQGSIAAKNALGIPTVYHGTTPLHILKVAGFDLTAVGQKYAKNPDEKEILHKDRAWGKYMKLIHNEKQLLGAISLGHPGLGFRIEKFIKAQKPIQPILEDLKAGRWEVLKQK